MSDSGGGLLNAYYLMLTTKMSDMEIQDLIFDWNTAPGPAPTSSPERIAAIAATATGFVYAVSTLGVTGVRESLSERAEPLVTACRAATDLPVLIGIGVSTPAHAVEASGVSDGVVIGSAVVARLSQEGPSAAESFLGDVRAALDTP